MLELRSVIGLLPFLLLLLCTGDIIGAAPKPVWEEITPAEAQERLASDEPPFLVDVRTPPEFHSRHIPGAILLPVADLEAEAELVLPDKDAVYILYCRSGVRSAQAANLLTGMGYQHVYDLGGIISWPYATEPSP